MKTLLAVALAAAPTYAGQVCHSTIHASSPTNWSQPFVLPKHDPALGALQSVTVTLRGAIDGSEGMENPSPAPATYATRFAALIAVLRPDSTELVSVDPSVESQVPLGPYDGTLDLGGPSGRSFTGLHVDRELHVTLSSPADLALFSAAAPGETIQLAFSAQGVSTASGPGALVVQFVMSASAQVDICYGYREIRATASIPTQATNWLQPLAFAKHDPAVGPLRAVRIGTRTTISGVARHESLDTHSSITSMQIGVLTRVFRPDGTEALSLVTYQDFIDPVLMYDGTLDFGGTSGATHSGILLQTSALATLTSAADLALFTAAAPGETVTVAIRADGVSNATGTGGVITQFLTSAATEIELAYDYSAPIVPFCFGDGSGTACPCGNASTTGAQQGCLNSFGLGGELRGDGFAEIGADTLVLTASNLPPNTSALFFQGTSALSVTFGDGLRCAGGAIRRLGVRAASGGAASCPPPGATISALGQATAGATLRYQAWYRNSAPFCTASTFNLTNGLAIAW